MKKLSQSLMAQTIIAKRKEKKMTQQQLSDATGINRAVISRMESLDFMPSIPQLEVLGEVLGFELTSCTAQPCDCSGYCSGKGRTHQQ